MVFPFFPVIPAEPASPVAVHAQRHVQLPPVLIEDIAQIVDHRGRADVKPVGLVGQSRLPVFEMETVTLSGGQPGGVEFEMSRITVGIERQVAGVLQDPCAVLALDIATDEEILGEIVLRIKGIHP